MNVSCLWVPSFPVTCRTISFTPTLNEDSGMQSGREPCEKRVNAGWYCYLSEGHKGPWLDSFSIELTHMQPNLYWLHVCQVYWGGGGGGEWHCPPWKFIIVPSFFGWFICMCSYQVPGSLCMCSYQVPDSLCWGRPQLLQCSDYLQLLHKWCLHNYYHLTALQCSSPEMAWLSVLEKVCKNDK